MDIERDYLKDEAYIQALIAQKNEDEYRQYLEEQEKIKQPAKITVVKLEEHEQQNRIKADSLPF